MAARHLSRSKDPTLAAQQQPIKWVRSRLHPEATKLAILSIRVSLGSAQRCFLDPLTEDLLLLHLSRGPREEDLPRVPSASSVGPS